CLCGLNCGEGSKRGIAARYDIVCVARHLIRIEIESSEMDGIETEKCPVAGHIGHEIDRWLIPLRAGGAGRLTDIFVIEHDLRPPNAVVVEIMLPAQPQDLARVVAAEPGLIGGRRGRGAAE